MQVLHINRKDTQLFSEHQLRLVYDQEALLNYIHQPFSLENFTQQIALKSEQYSDETRTVLVNALQNQYGDLANGDVAKNIALLKNKSTFSVTTGHQLTLLAGPVYFIVKILQVIKLASELKVAYPDQDFVPVYWMASEDHDSEEIQSTTLFNKSITVDYKQEGPVGQFDLTGFDEFKEEISSFFGDDKQAETLKILEAYSGDNLAAATRGLVNALFGEYGLVIIDGDDASLKNCFKPIMKAELLDQASEKLVIATSEQLKSDGFKVQVYPRPINLFYIEKGVRDRIELVNGKYQAGSRDWSQDELMTLLEDHPEHFSPNVVLRPVYQEMILPNLAYVGGAGEISYWLQLKEVFKNNNVQFPLIQVRNSILWIDKASAKKIDKTNLQINEVFTASDQLKKQYVEANGEDTLDFEMLDELKLKLTEEIRQRIVSVNSNLEQFANAEGARLEKQLEGIKSKLVKDSKGKHEQAMKDIDFIKERLFPQGGLQERSTNFLTFCADGEVKSRLNHLFSVLDPFGKDLIVLLEKES